ncbi:MAG: hypothetical protein K2J62_01155 [Bacteroidales bacterium]|nr:hypothetical protein [Bacteroidales bacterium]
MQNNSNKNKIIARNAFFLYGRMIVVTIVSLFTTRVVLRELGVEDYGIYNVVGGFVGLFAVLNTSLSSGITRYFNIAIGKSDEDGIHKVYNMAFRIQVFMAIGIVLLLEIFGLWYLNAKMVLPQERIGVANWLFQFSVLSTVIMIIQIPYTSAILSYERLDFYAIVSLIDVVLKLLIVYLLVLTPHDKLWFYGLWTLVITILNFLLYYIYCKKHFSKVIRLKRGFDKFLFKSMLSFSVWSFLDPIAYAIRGQGCNMVLNLYFGPIVNAAYGLSNQIAVALDKFAGNFSMAFRPQLIQSYSAGEYNRTKRLLYSMSKISFIIQSMIFIPLMFEIDNVLHLWLGNNFPSYAIPFTILILIVKNINSLNTPITTVVQATGNIKRYMLLSSIIVSMILPVTWICLELGCSPVSMYIAMVILTAINQYVCVAILHKVFPEIGIMEYLYKVVVPCSIQTIAEIVAMLMLTAFVSPSLVRILLSGCISIIITVSIAFAVTLDSSEKDLVRRVLANVQNRFSKRS